MSKKLLIVATLALASVSVTARADTGSAPGIGPAELQGLSIIQNGASNAGTATSHRGGSAWIGTSTGLGQASGLTIFPSAAN